MRRPQGEGAAETLFQPMDRPGAQERAPSLRLPRSGPGPPRPAARTTATAAPEAAVGTCAGPFSSATEAAVAV